MSDAIVLDVADATPVRLDVGDADPIARQEIAELAERVEAIEADYVTSEDVMGALGGEAPALVAGSSRAMLGDPETASWMERTTAADGAALVESVKGNTLRWNQLAPMPFRVVGTHNGVTYTANDSGLMSVSGQSTAVSYIALNDASGNSLFSVAGHKYLAKKVGTNATADNNFMLYNNDHGGVTTGSLVSAIGTAVASQQWYAYVKQGVTFSGTIGFQLFDLTAMFGAGNEPATVAEFEALYPLPYYPYDPGSLLPVRMEGVETVGFNQWDGEVEPGIISGATGLPSAMGYNEYRRAKNYVPCLPSTVYNFTSPSSNMYVVFYDVDRTPIKRTDLDSYQYLLYSGSHELTAPANARYIRFNFQANYVPNHDICINISDPARNGTYEPYWSEQRTIAAIAEKFPDGMRSAGTVRDELTETQAITRVGSVDLGTLNWEYVPFGEGHWRFYARLNDMARGLDMICANYDVVPASVQYTQGVKSISAQVSGSNYIVMIVDEAYATIATFKAAMSGVMLHYALATPTTTPIDPPLNLTYRTEQGGTERVMVPTGETSAPPTIVAAHGYTAESLRDAALSAIAPVENGLASTNYGVGAYLIHGGQLCKVTTAIATGEAITIGTNVTATTVMAEVIALIAQ